MRKLLYGMFLLVTICLIVMTVWTGGIARSVNSQPGQSATGPFQNAEDVPIEANITVNTKTAMYEGVPNSVHFNISLVILGPSPMNMTIRRIEIVFSPLDLETRTEADLPKVVGGYWTTLQIANATRVNIEGSVGINPVIISGDVFLGCGIDYIITNRTSTGPCEYGDDCWFGTDGPLFLLPVIVYPSFLQLTGWSYGLSGMFLIWCLTALNELRERWS